MNSTCALLALRSKMLAVKKTCMRALKLNRTSHHCFIIYTCAFLTLLLLMILLLLLLLLLVMLSCDLST